MQIIKGKTRIVLVFDNFVIKLPALLYWFNRAKMGASLHYKCRHKPGLKNAIQEFIRLFFIPMGSNLSEFFFYRRSKHMFCAKTYFSFFGLFNIQERVINLKGSDLHGSYSFPRYEEYKNVLDAVFLNKKENVESHTFLNPTNFGFSKKRNVFVCVDYEDQRVQENILEFGDRLQEAFKDFDK